MAPYRLAAAALVLALAIAPARADIIVSDLLFTDLFLWPDWRDILSRFDCTEGLIFYLWNGPPPVVVVVPPVAPPIVEPPYTPPVIVPPPPYTPPVIVPPPVNEIPESSPWLMMVIGFAALGALKFKRRRLS